MAATNRPIMRTRNSQIPTSKPWTPSSLQLKWYESWTVENLGPTEIAKRHSVTRQIVWAALRKTDEWYELQSIHQIRLFRQRLLDQYEMSQRFALQEFRDSVGEVVTIKKVVRGGKAITTTKTEQSFGDPLYLAKYMAATNEIAELLGLKVQSHKGR